MATWEERIDYDPCISLHLPACYQLAYYHQTYYSHANRCTRPLGSCLCTGAGAGVLFGSGNCAKRESPIYIQLHLYIRAHSYVHVLVDVHGVAQVKSDTWCGRLPAGVGGDVTVLPDHLREQIVI